MDPYSLNLQDEKRRQKEKEAKKKRQADQKRCYARSDNWKKSLKDRLEADRALYELAGPHPGPFQDDLINKAGAALTSKLFKKGRPVGAIYPVNCSVAEDPRGFYFRVRFAGLEGVPLEQLPTCRDIEREEEENCAGASAIFVEEELTADATQEGGGEVADPTRPPNRRTAAERLFDQFPQYK